MYFLVCLLLATATPVEQAEEDMAALFPPDAPYVRYLYLDNIDEKERDGHLAVVSFVLNSVSTKRKIVKPVFVNKDKTVIRFDIRDYGIEAKNYGNLPVDPYVKKIDKLKLALKCENPIMRTDWFISKAMSSPYYYKFLGVLDLKEFRKRHDHDPDRAKKLRVEQAAIVVSSGVARNARYIKRTETVTGGIWESRDSKTVDYLTDLFSEKYDHLELIAFNPNGLLSYFAVDSKGKTLEQLDVDITADHSRSFDPDMVVRVARNCVACHVTGILPIDDGIRNLIKRDIKITASNKDMVDRLNDLFGSDLPIKKDQDTYAEALMKATGMEPKIFAQKFIGIHQAYFADVTLEQAAKEMRLNPEDLKKECLASGQAGLVHLAVIGKLRRTYFEEMLKGR